MFSCSEHRRPHAHFEHFMTEKILRQHICVTSKHNYWLLLGGQHTCQGGMYGGTRKIAQMTLQKLQSICYVAQIASSAQSLRCPGYHHPLFKSCRAACPVHGISIGIIIGLLCSCHCACMSQGQVYAASHFFVQSIDTGPL